MHVWGQLESDLVRPRQLARAAGLVADGHEVVELLPALAVRVRADRAHVAGTNRGERRGETAVVGLEAHDRKGESRALGLGAQALAEREHVLHAVGDGGDHRELPSVEAVEFGGLLAHRVELGRRQR